MERSSDLHEVSQNTLMFERAGDAVNIPRSTNAPPSSALDTVARAPARTKTYPALEFGQTTSEGLSAIFQHDFQRLLAWEGTARSWDDIEGVHQVRVSFRRMRSALSVFSRVLAPESRRGWSTQMKELVEVTGRARDLDVLLSEGLDEFGDGDSHPGAAAFRDAIEEQRARAYVQVRQVLDSHSYADFKQSFAAWFGAREWEADDLPAKRRMWLNMGITSMARQVLFKSDEKVFDLLENANLNDPVDMHRLRIAGKKLRYGSEFFYHLFDDMHGFIAHLKGMQDDLGVMHDFAVTPVLIGEALGERVSPAMRSYAEALLLRRSRENQARQRGFLQHWQAFSSAARPW
jgi:CHAD domain-containing protein